MCKLIPIVALCLFLTGCQSGCFSRLGAGPAKLPIPTDCAKVISLGKGDKGGKYLSYLATDGKIKMKEYSDYGVLEAEYELEGATFDSNLMKK
jgi:hypothetical protein